MIIKNIEGKGKGLFTERSFSKDDMVLKIEGTKLNHEESLKLDKEQQDNLLQIGKDLFLDISKEKTIFINHSCNPNCYLKAIVNSAFLIALRPILKGEELTFDYSLTSTDTPETWSMKCNCHKYQCRKQISGFEFLPQDKKEEVIKNKLVPRYISTKNDS